MSGGLQTPAQLGQKFIDDLVAAAPEDQREAVRSALTNPAVVEQAGRHAAELDSWRQGLDQWHREHPGSPTATGKPGGLQTPATDLPADIVRADTLIKTLDQRMAAESEGAMAYMEAITKLSTEHLRRFNEVLDPTAIREHAVKHKLTLAQAYTAVHGERVKQQDDDAAAAAAAKREAEIRADERSKMVTQGGTPYPLAGADPSPLDAIKPEGAKGASVEEMAATYAGLAAGTPR